MELGLKGKRTLITGAGRGIGRSISLCLAREGAHVVVVSRTDSDVKALINEMNKEGQGHYGVTMDLMPEDGPKKLMNDLKKANFGPIDIIVHNLGGTLDITDPLCPIDDWRKVWRFNLEVAIELNLLLLPSMRERGWGRIVHVSSISAMENHGPITYCAAKAALTAYARSLGRVLAPEGIVVTAVLPGAVFTEGGYWDIVSRKEPEHVKKYLAERMAIHRFGKPDEIGNAVTFLCSEEASFFTGSIIPIDGGQGRSFFGQ
ncbi:MAG: SDR family oxidoreductase [Candidatus Omnitrophica bacterium]|nr:SDR family oxidoreductase [Candidatus Omnitrophota bacterium]